MANPAVNRPQAATAEAGHEQGARRKGAAAKKPSPQRRLLLGEILKEAAELLAEGGLQELTMRRLADALGVRAPSLYGHVRSRQALLAEVLRWLPDRPDPPSDSLAWQEALRCWMIALREFLLANRWIPEAMGMVGYPMWMLHQGALVHEFLERSGFPPDAADLHNRVLWWSVFGFVRVELPLPNARHAPVEGMEAGGGPRRYRLISVASQDSDTPPIRDVVDLDQVFRALVDRLVSGLEVELASLQKG